MTAPIPPVAPVQPAGAILDLRIDVGRTVVGGHTTVWQDQVTGQNLTPPGGQVGPVVSATQYQQYDGQNWPGSTTELSQTVTTYFGAGQGATHCWVLGVGQTSATSVIARFGNIGLDRTLFVPECGFDYTDGTTNTSCPHIGCGGAGGSPTIYTLLNTPGSGAIPVLYMNGFLCKAPYTSVNPAGAQPIDVPSAGLQVGHQDNSGARYAQGDLEEGIAYASQLAGSGGVTPTAGSALANLIGSKAAKFVVPSVAGFVCDSAAPCLFGMALNYQSPQSYASNRIYTTATNLSLFVQCPLGLVPGTPTPCALTVYVDGAYFETIAITPQLSPYTPVSYALAALDGNPHVVEIVNGPNSQSTVSAPVGCFVTGIQDPLGLTQLYPEAIGANLLLLMGDSIAACYGVTDPSLGTPELLRYGGALNGRIANASTAARAVFTDQSFDATYAATSNMLAAMATKVQGGGEVVIFFTLGTNDYGLATYATAAAWATAAGTFLDKIHATIPGAIVVWITPGPRNFEANNNANGWNLPGLRAAAATAASTRAYVNFVQGNATFNGVANYSLAQIAPDGVHPAAAGQLQQKLFWTAILQSVAPSLVQSNDTIFFGTEA